MSDATYTTKKEITTETVNYIVKLFNDGKEEGFIISNLVQNGYSYEDSEQTVQAIAYKKNEAQAKHDKGNSGLDIGLGLVILIIGIGITVSGAGVIAYGAIAVGAIKLIRGLSNL